MKRILMLVAVIFPLGMACAAPPAALDQAIRDIGSTRTFLSIAAHPGEEDLATLIRLRRELGARVVVVLADWGEAREGIALYPPTERASRRSENMRRVFDGYGIELRCLDLADYGYANTQEQVLRRWKRETIVDGLVRLIRQVRPDTVIGATPPPNAQAQVLLEIAKEAVRKSADETYLPDVKPFWEVASGFDLAEPAKPDADSKTRTPLRDPLLGETYEDLAAGETPLYSCDSVGRRIDLPSKVWEFERNFGDEIRHVWEKSPPKQVSRWDKRMADLRKICITDTEGILKDLLDLQKEFVGIKAAIEKDEGLSERCVALGLDLKRKEGQIHRAIALAAGVTLEVEISNPPIAAGEEFGVECRLRSEEAGQLYETSIEPDLPKGFELTGSTLESPNGPTDLAENTFTIRAATSADLLRGPDVRLRGLGGPIPPLFSVRASFSLSEKGDPVTVEEPVYADLVPPIEISVIPEKPIVCFEDTAELWTWLKIVNHTSQIQVGIPVLRPPKEWEIVKQGFPRVEAAPGDSTFVSYLLRAKADLSGPIPLLGDFLYGLPAEGEFLEGVDAKDLRKVSRTEQINVVKVSCPKDLKVGWVSSGRSDIGAALRGLDVDFEEIPPGSFDSAAFPRFDTVIVDVLAYSERSDLQVGYRKLRSYVLEGGNLVILGNPLREGGKQFPPFPLTTSDLRIVDATAPVRVLDSKHPLVTSPNPLAEKDFDGWHGERGTEFAAVWDGAYLPLLAVKGSDGDELLGGYLVSKFGDGSCIYTGFAWGEELRRGHVGAFKAFANMVAYRRTRAQSAEETAEEKEPQRPQPIRRLTPKE
jgi:LmbE family N-acetylglucosaminyl deacetylase